jgi:dipeptidyl aminopeptidase/acylaminoacyl peptidase
MRERRIRPWASTLVLLLAAAPALAQLYRELKGPGLDSTPIEIPAALAGKARPITPRDLLEIRDLFGVSISPDGTRVAFVVGQAVAETNRYRTALFVVGAREGSVGKPLGNVGPPFWKGSGEWFPEAPAWSPDGRSLAVRMNRGNGWQVWRWNPEGGEPVAITHCPRDVQNFRWSEDGKRIVFEVYPTSDRERVRRMQDGGVLYDQDFQAPWDVNTPVVDAKLSFEEAPTETWLHDLETGSERVATKEEIARESLWVRGWETLNVVDAAWSPDHKRLAYNKYVDDPARCRLSCYPLFVSDADGKNERLLTPGVYFARSPQWSADGSRIYFERYDGDGRGSALAEVPAAGGPIRVLVPNTAHLSDCSWDRRKEHAVCVVEDNVTPPRVAVADVKTGTLRVVADVNPEFRNLRLSPGTRIDWKNENRMFAYLVKPAGYEPGKRYPVIVTTYRSGTGFLRGGVGDEYPIHVFAANGFAVLAFDCGADLNNAPGDFDTAMRIWEAPLEGLRESLRIAGEMGVADLDRVGFTGLSHGSEIGAFAISKSNLFRTAAMSGSGSWDRLVEQLMSNRFRHWFRQWGLLGPDDLPVPERFQRLSATENVERIHTPLLIHAPDSEYLMALPLYAAMRDRKKPVEMWIYPNEYHVKVQPRHRLSVYERNVDWFRFWLKGEEDPDPSKGEQYARWRKLRELDAADRKEKANAK